MKKTAILSIIALVLVIVYLVACGSSAVDPLSTTARLEFRDDLDIYDTQGQAVLKTAILTCVDYKDISECAPLLAALNGQNGVDGTNGADGATGPQGEPGEDAVNTPCDRPNPPDWCEDDN